MEQSRMVGPWARLDRLRPKTGENGPDGPMAGRLPWRAVTLLAAAGFGLVAAPAFLVGIAALFRLEALAPEPPPLLVPAVPLCFFGALGTVFLALGCALPKAPPRVVRRAAVALYITMALAFGLVWLVLVGFVQRHTGNAPGFLATLAVQLLAVLSG